MKKAVFSGSLKSWLPKNIEQQIKDQAALEALAAPETARFDAFIRAILNAPVKLAPKPSLTAKAGTKIMDATTKPVPNNKEPLLVSLTAVCASCLFIIYLYDTNN